MRIQRVEIENIKGIESAAFEPGTLTILSGENGSGKTSILDAISSVFNGGHDPGLLRKGAEHGKVVLTLGDGVAATTITKHITASASRLVIQTADGLTVSRPTEYVARLASGFQFDPVAFLDAKPGDQVKYLLRVMPTKLTAEDAAALGFGSGWTLTDLEIKREAVYAERRVLNKQAADLEGAIRTSRGLMQDDDEDWIEKAQAAAETASAALQGWSKQRAEMTAEVKAAVQQAERQRDEAIAAATIAAGERLAAAVAEISRIQAEREAELTGQREVVRQLEAAAKDAGEKAARQQQQRGAAEEVDRLAVRASTLKGEAAALTANLALIDEIKQRKVEQAPVPGLACTDGEVTYHGIRLDQINTQQQLSVALQVAALSAGDVAFMVIDRAESIVGDRWKEFQSAAAESGWQIIAGRSEDAPLRAVVDGVERPVFGQPARRARRGGKAAAEEGRYPD